MQRFIKAFFIINNYVNNHTTLQLVIGYCNLRTIILLEPFLKVSLPDIDHVYVYQMPEDLIRIVVNQPYTLSSLINT